MAVVPAAPTPVPPSQTFVQKVVAFVKANKAVLIGVAVVVGVIVLVASI